MADPAQPFTGAIPKIGVGLRHTHYADALNSVADIDFLEVHAENFFAEGGAALAVLDEISQHYAISIHGTALSLGSYTGLCSQHLHKLQKLVQRVSPLLISDHACFARTLLNNQPVHVGDLLPIEFNERSLACLVRNIQQVQEILGRPMLIENLSAYIQLPGATLTETEFLVNACQQTDCQLLLDLNNLVVNAHNANIKNIVPYVIDWIEQIPSSIVGEFHLAGCTPVPAGEIMVDDHSQPVPDEVWQVYEHALRRFGPVPTLIEWDTHLPTWNSLLKEAHKARDRAKATLTVESSGTAETTI